MVRHIALAVVAVLAVAGLAHAQQPSPQGWHQLSGAELQALASGHRIGGINQFEQPYLITHKPDGVVAGITRIRQSGDTAADTGRWAIEGNQLCTQFNHWRNGARVCSTIMTNGSQYRAENTAGSSPDIYLDRVPWQGGWWTGQ